MRQIAAVVRLGAVQALSVAVLAAALVAAASAPRSQAEPVRGAKSLSPVLGISYRSPERGTLAWFEPLTLRKIPGRKAPLGGYLGSWAFSADRAVLAIASCRGDQEPFFPGIRFVNTRVMRVLGNLRLSPFRGCAAALTWLRPDRLLAVVTTTDPPESELVVLDPIARRVLHRERLPEGWLFASGRTRDALVLLFSSPGEIAPARLAVVDAEGAVRVATVDSALAGTIVDDRGDDYRSRTVYPGLAVDPDGRRAFLVPASGPVAEVDLTTLAVSYRELDRPSLWQRFLRCLTPSAQAKVQEGPVREARWLGDGMIALSGMDYSIATNARGEELFTATPAGVSLIDTRSWTSGMLSREASGFAVVPGIVIAQGGRWDSQKQRSIGPGLLAFDLDGRERWRLRPGEYQWIDPAGSVGYVQIAERRTDVVDLASGRVLGTIRRGEAIESRPQLLAAQASGW